MWNHQNQTNSTDLSAFTHFIILSTYTNIILLYLIYYSINLVTPKIPCGENGLSAKYEYTCVSVIRVEQCPSHTKYDNNVVLLLFSVQCSHSSEWLFGSIRTSHFRQEWHSQKGTHAPGEKSRRKTMFLSGHRFNHSNFPSPIRPFEHETVEHLTYSENPTDKYVCVCKCESGLNIFSSY